MHPDVLPTPLSGHDLHNRRVMQQNQSLLQIVSQTVDREREKERERERVSE